MSTAAPVSASSYLVKGDDASLVAQEVRTLLAEVVGDRDHSLVVEEIGGGPGDDINVGAVVDACLTPPFLIDRRVVVVRDAGRLLTADVPRLVDVVKDPLPSTVLILVGGGGTVPAPLVKAVTAAGKVIDVSVSRPGDRKAWLHEHLRQAPGQAGAAGGPVAGPARRGGPRPGRGACSARWPRPTAPGPASPSTISSRTWARPATSPATSSPTPSTGAIQPPPSACCIA